MGWLEDWLTDLGGAAAPPGQHPITRAGEISPAAEIKSMWIQTRAPGTEDFGEVAACFYSVSDGVLTMRDENGKPTGKEHRLGPGDDAKQIAGRLALQAIQSARGQTDFNRPLDYTQWGVA
jgi:hypothetical protein